MWAYPEIPRQKLKIISLYSFIHKLFMEYAWEEEQSSGSGILKKGDTRREPA